MRLCLSGNGTALECALQAMRVCLSHNVSVPSRRGQYVLQVTAVCLAGDMGVPSQVTKGGNTIRGITTPPAQLPAMLPLRHRHMHA